MLDAVLPGVYTAAQPHGILYVAYGRFPRGPAPREDRCMYNKPMLSLDQVQRAMAAMLEQAMQRPDQPLAIAIVDDVGSLISYARMDQCRAIPQRMAVRKAYTAAVAAQDTMAYAERLKSQGRTVAEMGDPNLAAVQGGLVV